MRLFIHNSLIIMTYCPLLRHFVHSSANGLHLDIILHTFNHNRFIRIVVRFESFGMLEQLTNKPLTNGAQNICVLPIVMRRIVLDTNCLLQVLPTQSPYHYDCSVTLSAYVVTTASILFSFLSFLLLSLFSLSLFVLLTGQHT